MTEKRQIPGQLSIPAVDELMEEAERRKQMEWPVKAPLAVPQDLVCGGFGPDAIIWTAEATVMGPCGTGTTANILEQLVAEQSALAEGVVEHNLPDPEYSEDQKRERAKESWEYNMMSIDMRDDPSLQIVSSQEALSGEHEFQPGDRIAPDWQRSEIADEPITDPVSGTPLRQWEPLKVWQPDRDTAVEDEALRRDIREALQVITYWPGNGGGVITPPEAGDLRNALDVLVARLPELLGRYEALFALAEQVAKVSAVDRNGYYRPQRLQENKPGTDRMEP